MPDAITTETESVKALLEGVTPGPWEALDWEHENGGTDWNVWGPKRTNHTVASDLSGDFGSEADARFIAASRQLVPALLSERDALREAALDALAALVAAVSLLEGGGKKAAASDKMFAQMLVDYRASIERTRAALGDT